MHKYLTVVATVAAISLTLVVTSAASAQQVSYPRTPAPSWFTPSFKAQVDAAGPTGVPLAAAGPSATDVCPGVVTHENAVGTGTCLVLPYGCTANFVYYNGSAATAPTVADGHLYLGSAGHCSDKAGQVVYGQISTPGVGASIVRIGTVSKRVENYGNDGSVLDFEAIQIDSGLNVYPDSPVGGPQGIYDGCQAGTPVKLWGHGYAVEMGQGKPEGGISANWYDSGYGWEGPSFPGDSGSGVIDAASGQAAGNLDAIVELYVPPVYNPGEIIGTRITSILSFLGSGYSLVNADQTLSRDTTTACGQPSGKSPLATNGGKGGGGGGGGGKPPKAPKI